MRALQSKSVFIASQCDDSETKKALNKSSFFMNPQFSKTAKQTFLFFSTTCRRCENEIEAIMKNRKICSSEGLGKRSPQREGRRRQNLVLPGTACYNAAKASYSGLMPLRQTTAGRFAVSRQEEAPYEKKENLVLPVQYRRIDSDVVIAVFAADSREAMVHNIVFSRLWDIFAGIAGNQTAQRKGAGRSI